MRIPITFSVLSAVFALGASKSRADLVFVPAPTSSTASSSFSGNIANWGPQRLYDQNPTEADLGADFGGAEQYAGQGAGPHIIVYAYGAAVTFNGLAYSQRLGGNPVLDKVQNIDVWVTDTDPGDPSLLLPDPGVTLGAAAANTGQLNINPGIFENYGFGGDLMGQYVVMRLNDAGGDVGNPGGSELHLTTETGPADPDLDAPASFDFGSADASEATVDGQFTVTNAGATQMLEISGITFEGGSFMRFDDISFPATLGPGESGDVVLRYTTEGEAGIFNTQRASPATTRMFPSRLSP